MAGVRDPAFWKRFSVAVHMDEEQAQSPDYKLAHKDSWLARQNAKRSKRTCICWTFWLSFFIFVAGIVAVIIWLLQSGILEGGSGTGSGSSSDAGTSSGGSSSGSSSN